ncbi:MAG: hypothetical protein HY902_05515, partial [Deltaproteobacteria bacterium]|nr:hypothetical protein [Deltaproteobacteria bacterium]
MKGLAVKGFAERGERRWQPLLLVAATLWTGCSDDGDATHEPSHTPVPI